MIENHRLLNAKYIPSGNHNERPKDLPISLIVIHNISLPPNEFNNEYVEDFFTNQLDTSLHPYFNSIKDLAVSAHLLIKRDGSTVQFVDFNKRAWHAGKSSFNNIENCNNYSIGIELQGSDNTAYESVQYQVLNKVIAALKEKYPITDIVGHSDIAPGRKTDPGAMFNWEKLV